MILKNKWVVFSFSADFGINELESVALSVECQGRIVLSSHAKKASYPFHSLLLSISTWLADSLRRASRLDCNLLSQLTRVLSSQVCEETNIFTGSCGWFGSGCAWRVQQLQITEGFVWFRLWFAGPEIKCLMQQSDTYHPRSWVKDTDSSALTTRWEPHPLELIKHIK